MVNVTITAQTSHGMPVHNTNKYSISKLNIYDFGSPRRFGSACIVLFLTLIHSLTSYVLGTWGSNLRHYFFCAALQSIEFDSFRMWILHLFIPCTIHRINEWVESTPTTTAPPPSNEKKMSDVCLFSFVLITSRVYRSFIAVCCLFYMDLSF